MRYSTLRYALDGRIARITLNRPERLNAINEKMPREIRAAVEAANEDDRVHVIVLAGAGVGLSDHRDVGLPARRREGQANAPDRRHHRRQDRKSLGPCV